MNTHSTAPKARKKAFLIRGLAIIQQVYPTRRPSQQQVKLAKAQIMHLLSELHDADVIVLAEHASILRDDKAGAKGAMAESHQWVTKT